MYEELIKNDKRIIKFKMGEISCLKCIPEKIDQLIIYCHGIGMSKEEVLSFYEPILENNIGIIAFDFPSHGESQVNEFNLSKCKEYIEKVFNYIKNEYPNINISILGSSFGAYVILNKIMDNNNFYKVLLKSTAINFLEAAQIKLDIPDNYFDYNEYLGPFLNIKLSKRDYFEFKDNDLTNSFIKLKDNIYMIHGDEDRTITLDRIINFSQKYNITLKIISGARHSFKNNLKDLTDFILEELK